MRRRQRVWGATSLVLMAGLVVAGSCGGGGRSLADLAKGDWACDYREVGQGGPPGPAVGLRATATITEDDGSHGGFKLALTRVAAPSQKAAIAGDWRLTGRNLAVTITDDPFGAGGTLDYRGVAEGTRRIEVRGSKAEPFKPVAVARRGGSYEFRWSPYEGRRARLTCRRP